MHHTHQDDHLMKGSPYELKRDTKRRVILKIINEELSDARASVVILQLEDMVTTAIEYGLTYKEIRTMVTQ